jgi:hypothetical protein
MEVETILARVTAPERGGRVLDGHSATLTDALTGPGAEREGALHRRSRDPCQHRRVFPPLVGRARNRIAISEPPPIEQAPDAGHDCREHIGDIQRSE